MLKDAGVGVVLAGKKQAEGVRGEGVEGGREESCGGGGGVERDRGGERGASQERSGMGESGVCDLHVRVDGRAERSGDRASIAGELHLVGEEGVCGGGEAGVCLYSSPAFDLTVTSIYTGLVSGGEVVVYGQEGRDKEGVLGEIVGEKRVGVLKLTPSHLGLIKEWTTGGSGVKRLIVGGEALSRELAEQVRESFGGGVEICNEYGPTEATVGCMIYRYRGGEEKLENVPIGQGGANQRIYVLDERMNPVGEKVTGELYIGGEGVGQGYWGKAGTDGGAVCAGSVWGERRWEVVQDGRPGEVAAGRGRVGVFGEERRAGEVPRIPSGVERGEGGAEPA